MRQFDPLAQTALAMLPLPFTMGGMESERMYRLGVIALGLAPVVLAVIALFMK